MYEYPPILHGTEQEQLRALRDYLVRMTRSLQAAETAALEPAAPAASAMGMPVKPENSRAHRYSPRLAVWAREMDSPRSISRRTTASLSGMPSPSAMSWNLRTMTSITGETSPPARFTAQQRYKRSVTFSSPSTAPGADSAT